MFCDNKSTIVMAENTVFHEKTKHVEIDCYLIRKKVQQGIIKLMFVSSSSQLTYGFTKALPTSQIETFSGKLGYQNLYSPAYLGGGMLKDTSQGNAG